MYKEEQPSLPDIEQSCFMEFKDLDAEMHVNHVETTLFDDDIASVLLNGINNQSNDQITKQEANALYNAAMNSNQGMVNPSDLFSPIQLAQAK